MSLHKLNLIPFFAPTETPPEAIEDKSLSKEDTIDFLGEDEEDDSKPETIELDKENKSADKDGTEKTIEDEIEEELEEPDEEKLELTTPVRRKEILSKYPTLFKDFPYLENAYYREQKYSEILPTIEDAQIALEKSTKLDGYEEDLLKGSTESILTTVKDNDKEAFNKIVDNYLPTLMKVDEGAYYTVIGNIIKHTIITMVNEGRDGEGNDELLAAANVLNRYIFGTDKFIPPSRLSKIEEKSDKEAEIEAKQKEFDQHQFETHGEALETKVSNILKSTVDRNIDPKDSMTDYVKKNATKDALNNLEEIISQDVRFSKIMDKLWEKAISDKFSQSSMDRIKQAYLSKAKTLLPSVIKKSRNEALRGMGKRVDDDYSDSSSKKGPLPVGQTRRTTPSHQSSGKTDKDRAKEIPKGMKSIDFLMQD